MTKSRGFLDKGDQTRLEQQMLDKPYSSARSQRIQGTEGAQEGFIPSKQTEAVILRLPSLLILTLRNTRSSRGLLGWLLLLGLVLWLDLFR